MGAGTDGTGDRSYADFVRRQWSSLYRTAYLMTGDHQDAEDAAQSALMKVYLTWPRVSRMDHPAAYARTVLVHQLVSRWRRRSTWETPSLLLEDAAQPPFDDDVVEARIVWALVLGLPPRQRAVVVLRYYEDLSEADIATTLGISAGSVKTHAHHALARLRQELGHSLDGALADDRHESGGGRL